MVNPQTVMYDEEFNQIQAIVDRLLSEASARFVFIVDKNGQLIACSGEDSHVDLTSLASLTAGCIAATSAIAQLLGEREFPTQFHEGQIVNLHIQLVGSHAILVVVFDGKSSLGLVRLRGRKATEALSGIFASLLTKAREPGIGSAFEDVTDEDIDDLFND